MAKPANANNRNVDPRKVLSYRIAYPESHLKITVILLSIVACGIGCFMASILDEDITMKLENFKGCMLQAMVFMLALNECVIHRKTVNRIFDYLNKCKTITRYGLKEEADIMKQADDSAYKIITFSSLFLAANFLLMVATGPLLGVIGGQSWKKLPYIWPISEANDWLLYSSFLVQLAAIFISHCVATAGIALLTVTKQISAVFDVVILGINHIEERAALKMSKEGLSYNESRLSCLRESISHHQEVVDELLLEKPHLEFTFFSQIMFISVIMACETYPLIMVDLDLIKVIKGIWFLIVQIMCCAFLNFEMDVLSNKNVEVCDALYGTPWYACDTKYRRVLLNGMTFSQNPIWIRGMGLLNMKASRAAFYSAMVSSYNLLNMLRNADNADE